MTLGSDSYLTAVFLPDRRIPTAKLDSYSRVGFLPPCRKVTLQSQKTRFVQSKTVPAFCDIPVVAQKYYKPARTSPARFFRVVWCIGVHVEKNRSKTRETTLESICRKTTLSTKKDEKKMKNITTTTKNDVKITSLQRFC